MKIQKRIISLILILALCMSYTLCIPVFASEPESLEIEVNDEQDILEFLFSDEFDPHVAYRFVYPDSLVMARITCPKCRYNSLVGKTVEKYDLCHPSSQGLSVQCPEFLFATDVFNVMLVYVYQYCNTCGYKSTETFSESKYYIGCLYHEESYIATDYKTQHRTGNDPHEWKDTWSLYYDDPHYS